MKKEDLLEGRWYAGLVRFVGGIALWTGTRFVGFQFKFGNYLETSMDFDEDLNLTLVETE